MKKIRSVVGRILFFCAVCALVSCVKDVDFDQAQEMGLSPELKSDLLIYNLNEVDFQDPDTKELKTIIRDTVRLEFLDDDYIQDNLRSVEFYFRHISSFPQPISSKIHFLSNRDRRQFSVDYIIAPGSTANPAVTDTIEIIEEERIHLVRNSIQVAVELELLSSGEDLDGELDFASFGVFNFEF